MNVTAYDLAQRFVGIKEVAGSASNPAILAMLKLDGAWPADDAVPWCSAFTNYIAWLLRLPRSKSLRARSWLLIGTPVALEFATPGFDVVIFNRGGPHDPTVIEAPGHVAFYGGRQAAKVIVLGGNQGDSVSLAQFPQGDVLGVRRLHGSA